MEMGSSLGFIFDNIVLLRYPTGSGSKSPSHKNGILFGLVYIYYVYGVQYDKCKYLYVKTITHIVKRIQARVRV